MDDTPFDDIAKLFAARTLSRRRQRPKWATGFRWSNPRGGHP